MSRIAITRNKLRLKGVIGIRARIAVLALILVGPLMVDRIRVLEDFRETQVARASEDFARLAETSADAQSQIVMSIEAVVRASAYIYAASSEKQTSCTALRSSLRANMPWVKSISIAKITGEMVCSTQDGLVALNFAKDPYFQKAVKEHRFTISDYLVGKHDGRPIVIATFPVSALMADGDAMVFAAFNLDWMSKIMNNLGNPPGLSAMLIDSAGTIIAAPSDRAELIGQPLDPGTLRAARSVTPPAPGHSVTPVTFTWKDGSQRTVWAAEVSGMAGRLVLSIDHGLLTNGADKDIVAAYLQLAAVCIFVLLGALFASERLIIRPIITMADIARRFGQGDWSARANQDGLPAEFVPLALAFNEMATQLGAREREMLKANDRLTVMASIDALTGLANRRGFQSRLDFEWMKAQQTGDDLALMMIDVDHFKAFNDNYGHPEGDACLARVGQTLSAIAHDAMGFAARYGGEEFCLLLPGTDANLASEVGERIRAAIEDLAIPHATTATQRVTASVGLASTCPSAAQIQKDLVEAADAALYAAKHRGRNTVVCHGLSRASDQPLALTG